MSFAFVRDKQPPVAGSRERTLVVMTDGSMGYEDEIDFEGLAASGVTPSRTRKVWVSEPGFAKEARYDAVLG